MNGVGLLTGPWSDPRTAGLLTMGAHLLSQSGPSLQPVGTGQAIGGALLAGNQASTQAQQAQEAKLLRDFQLAKAQQEAEARQRFMGLLSPMPGSVESGNSNGGFSLNAPGTPTPQLASNLGLHPTAAAAFLTPGMERFGTAIQEANKPTDRQREAVAMGLQPGTQAFNAYVGTQFTQGGAWQIDPTTGQVRLAPGYAQGAGNVRGAEEAARAQFDFVEIPVAGGGTRMVPRSQAAMLLGRGAIPSQGNGPAALGGDIGYRAPEAERGANSRFAETIAAEMGKQYGELLKADFAAPGKIANYEQLGDLLGRVNTGKYRGTMIDFKAAAKSLGFDLSSMGIADDIAPAQAARALSNTLALELRNPAGGAGMPGALSDKDREFLIQSIPGLENDPAAISTMVQYRVRLAKREQQVAKMARDYKKRTGRFDDGFFDELASWSERNPLFTEAERKARPPIPKNPANRGGIQFMGFE